MENLRKDTGITLIALVITIIVLLILAGISIATLTGENGILTKATTAKAGSIKGEETEQIKLAYNAVLADKLEKSDNTEITADELKAELVKLEPEVTVTGSPSIIVAFNKSKNEYRVDTKGNVRENKIISFTLDGVKLSCSDGETWLSFGNSGGFGSNNYSWCYGEECSGGWTEFKEKQYLVWLDPNDSASASEPRNVDGIALNNECVCVTDLIIDGAIYEHSSEFGFFPNAWQVQIRIFESY